MMPNIYILKVLKDMFKRFSAGLDSRSDDIVTIKPYTGWKIFDFKELNEYRDLFYFLVWRDIKALYAQTVLGFLWAILQPLIQIVIFSIIFGKIAKIPTDGVPYILFSSVAIVPWTYISQSMTQASQGLISGSNLLGKVYFPRLIFPIIPILSRLIDFGISVSIIFGVMVFYRIAPTWNLLFFPLFFLMMMLIPAGVGLWLSSLSIRFRDVKYIMGFGVRMLMYTAPIVYSASAMPEKYRFFYSLNPIVGVIEGYRACLLGGQIPWMYVWPGIITSTMLFISGAFYFKKMENIVVDVI